MPSIVSERGSLITSTLNDDILPQPTEDVKSISENSEKNFSVSDEVREDTADGNSSNWSNSGNSDELTDEYRTPTDDVVEHENTQAVLREKRTGGRFAGFEYAADALANAMYSLSCDEMRHIDILHEQAESKINARRRSGEELPEGMTVVWKYVHGKHRDKACCIKLMQAQYKLWL